MTGPPSVQAHTTSKNGGSLPKREEFKFWIFGLKEQIMIICVIWPNRMTESGESIQNVKYRHTCTYSSIQLGQKHFLLYPSNSFQLTINNFDFFPLNRALSLENEEDSEERKIEQLQQQVDYLVAKMKEQVHV